MSKIKHKNRRWLSDYGNNHRVIVLAIHGLLWLAGLYVSQYCATALGIWQEFLVS